MKGYNFGADPVSLLLESNFELTKSSLKKQTNNKTHLIFKIYFQYLKMHLYLHRYRS